MKITLNKFILLVTGGEYPTYLTFEDGRLNMPMETKRFEEADQAFNEGVAKHWHTYLETNVEQYRGRTVIVPVAVTVETSASLIEAYYPTPLPFVQA